MDSYSVLIKPSAARELETIPRKDRTRIVEKVRRLAATPRPIACEKLSGLEQYRVRQGRYRIVYSISDKKRSVVVMKIAHRREAYR
ncbi:MAG: type II toxin-antitoxin system RelE/ParE family toxin [Acidobacteria bacterium]|nr:type II toxin-antitoxin system RelE/ParE family toxin [Acidobacteriota bacterium]